MIFISSYSQTLGEYFRSGPASTTSFDGLFSSLFSDYPLLQFEVLRALLDIKVFPAYPVKVCGGVDV